MIKSIYITDFGADVNNSDNSKYIQNAIDSLECGGEVIVPPGIFTSSAFNLKSNIKLYLMAGAVLKANNDLSLYPIGKKFDQGTKDICSFISVCNCENIVIEGSGIIDISGDSFFDFGFQEDKIEYYGEFVNDICAECHDEKRITLPIFFENCKNLRISQVKIINSSCWTITYNRCTDIKINSISIINNMRIPNSDGIHLSGCNSVIISNCIFECGDDCVAITNILDDKIKNENIIISDCVMKSSSSAIRIGHLNSRIENVIVKNCCIIDTNRGFSIFASNDGKITNVKISDCVVKTKIRVGSWWGKGEPFVICCSNSDGEIADICIRNISFSSENKAIVAGKLKSCVLSDCSFEMKYTNKRKFAYEYDISPNGKLKIENDFLGDIYIEEQAQSEFMIKDCKFS